MEFHNIIDIPSDEDDDEPQFLDVTLIRPYTNAVLDEEEEEAKERGDDIRNVDGDSGTLLLSVLAKGHAKLMKLDIEIISDEQFRELEDRSNDVIEQETIEVVAAYIHGRRYTATRNHVAELRDGSFIRMDGFFEFPRINGVCQKVHICGPMYKRAKFCRRLLPMKLNEVVEFSASGLISLDEVTRVRRIRFTNYLWRKHNDAIKANAHEMPLVCRWKLSVKSKYEGYVERLQPEDLSNTLEKARFRSSNNEQRRRFRRRDHARSTSGSYTFGDAFCGAGGVSSGARKAGLNIKWGFDHDRAAIEAYGSNFPGTLPLPDDVESFISQAKQDPNSFYVDILHLSPPCQPHSHAHTVEGKNDEINEAAGLCIENLLDAVKPRMVTLEQTDGIISRPDWFRTFIRSFVAQGFSTRWCVLHTNEYGVPQSRKRLIIVAAAPGEPMPVFPEPTHQSLRLNNPNLKRAMTVRDAIGNIPYDTDNHFPEKYVLREPISYPRTSMDGVVPTIRTRGLSDGYEVHPSGTRYFTPRELAAFQTFPNNHKFRGSDTVIKKQIGNAVPPIFACAIFAEIVRTLRAVDDSSRDEPPEVIDVDSLVDGGDDEVYEVSNRR